MDRAQRRIYHRLVPLNKVLDIIEKYYPLKPLGIEEVDLINALNRVLAEDIYAPIDHPPFDRSEVDGYAIRSIDVVQAYENNPVELIVKGYIPVGIKPRYDVWEKEAVEIATGAMIPRGADAVIMEEYTSRKGEKVLVYKSVYPGENISFAGSDVSAGDLLLTRGTLLTHREIGLLAGMGIRRVKVYRKPRVAVFSTGNEIIEPGEKLEPGKVYNVNSYLISSIVLESGGIPRYYGLLPDDYEEAYNRIKDAMDENDIIVTSGGTSAGHEDIMYKIFDSLGNPGVIIHGIKVKPGKPTVVAVAQNKLLIGLPGFPMSCYMIAVLILRRILEKLQGLKKGRTTEIYGRLSMQIKKNIGKTWLIPVTLIRKGDELRVYPVSSRSGDILPIVNSDGFAVLEEDREIYLENDLVKVVLFRDLNDLPKLVIIGSNDVLLYRLLVNSKLDVVSRVITTGSLGGWLAVKRGEADIAPTHLLDEETKEYNRPFLKKLGVSDKAVLIRGYDRRIGIVVEKGNPKNITGIEDFLRKDVTIVNRSKGSGIRIFLDIQLRNIAKEKGVSFEEVVEKINGYRYQVKSHTAVAVAIKQGRADAGIAVEYVAHVFNLDFIPLTWEQYDFLVNKSSMEKAEVKSFIEYIKSSEARKLIDSTPGYRVPDDIGEIIA